jgi:hypothetical protein
MKWEYKVVFTYDYRHVENEFNKLGLEGWELVSVRVGKYVDDTLIVFKRRLIESPTTR